MTTMNFLLEKYGPLLGYDQLAEILGRSADGLRVTVQSETNELARQLQPARRKIGRRVYFLTEHVAGLIERGGS